jgi:hypothetical protein
MEQKVVILGGGAWTKECCRGSVVVDSRIGGVRFTLFFASLGVEKRWILRKGILFFFIYLSKEVCCSSKQKHDNVF